MLIIDNEIPLESTVRFVQGVYFALKRRGLNINKGIALVLVFKGQKQGKTDSFKAADLRQTQETRDFQRIG